MLQKVVFCVLYQAVFVSDLRLVCDLKKFIAGISAFPAQLLTGTMHKLNNLIHFAIY